MSDSEQFRKSLEEFNHAEIARLVEMVFSDPSCNNAELIKELIVYVERMDQPSIPVITSDPIKNPTAIEVILDLQFSASRTALIVFHWDDLSDEQKLKLIKNATESVATAIIDHHLTDLSIEHFKAALSSGNRSLANRAFHKGITQEGQAQFEEGLEVGSQEYMQVSNGDFSSVAMIDSALLQQMRVLPPHSEIRFSDLTRMLTK